VAVAAPIRSVTCAASHLDRCRLHPGDRGLVLFDLGQRSGQRGADDPPDLVGEERHTLDLRDGLHVDEVFAAKQQRQLGEPDLPGASRALRKGCEGGLPIACHRWALLAGEAPEVAPEADVVALNLRACRAGVVPACAPGGESPGPIGPLSPSRRLMADRTSYALGIPGSGGFNVADLVKAPGGPRRSRAQLRQLPAGQLEGLSPSLRRRLDLEPPVGGEVAPDQPVELLIRLRRAQLATCLEGERTSPAAAQLAAFFLVESNGKPGELRLATEPVDPGLEACAREVLLGWSFPSPPGGVSGPYLVGFAFEAAPRGPAPRYASSGILRAALKDPGCPERNLRVPEAYLGAANAVTVKLVVDAAGKPVLFHALTPAPEAVVSVIGEALQACAFTPGVGEGGMPIPLWLTLTVRLDRR